MTDADLNAKIARQARDLATWATRANERIEAKLADARSHASKAVTDTLKRVPDGRATLRHVARSPSAKAAIARVDELWDWLAGPSISSTEGFIRGAREAFYRRSFEAWKPFIDPSLWVTPDAQPTQAGIRAARTVVLHGMDLRMEIGGPISIAVRSLKAALAVAGRREATGKDSAGILDVWHQKSLTSITAVVNVALSDSQIDADVQAGRDLIHPDNLE